MVPRSRLHQYLKVGQYDEPWLIWMVDCLLWFGDDGALIDFPVEKHALDAGLESGGKLLEGLPCVTHIVTFCHLGLVNIGKEWCESFDIVVGLLEQLGDGNWVVKARGESQQH